MQSGFRDLESYNTPVLTPHQSMRTPQKFAVPQLRSVTEHVPNNGGVECSSRLSSDAPKSVALVTLLRRTTLRSIDRCRVHLNSQH